MPGARSTGHAGLRTPRRFARWEGGKSTGPNPTDRGKAGSKHHLLTDATGLPLAAFVSAANVHDVRVLLPLVGVLLPRALGDRLPRELHADRGYDSERHRAALRLLGIEPHLRRRGTQGEEPLGHHRWPIERTFAHIKKNRRLRTRYDRSHAIHQGFLELGCIKLLARRMDGLC